MKEVARGLWGRGYATEAANGALRYAFETLVADTLDYFMKGPGR